MSNTTQKIKRVRNPITGVIEFIPLVNDLEVIIFCNLKNEIEIKKLIFKQTVNN